MENKDIQNLFEDHLQSNLPISNSFHPIFQDALQDMLKVGGKRFRPLLILNIINAISPLLVKNSLDVALGVEFLHTYSLIHDDLPSMDNADLRRGHTTLHKKYDETTAILVGDALNTQAFNLLANAPLSNDIKIELIKILSINGGIEGMIIGQAIDCYFENKILKLDELEFLHTHKTAKLIASSLKIGAIIANLDQMQTDKLYKFGIDLGLLFQIQDDIIDETYTQEEAGKTTSNDGAKNSFVNLLGLDNAIKTATQLANKCTDELNNFDTNINKNLSDLLSNYLYRHI